jgi:hypothetical protein
MASRQPSGPDQPASSAGTAKVPMSGIALVTALVVLTAFTGFVWYMITQRDTGDVSWSRLAWLFSSVEAIAFGAAGALFGSSVQRQRAEKAEAAAQQNAAAAANGRALAASIKADAAGSSDVLERAGSSGSANRVAQDLAARHAAIARELFP